MINLDKSVQILIPAYKAQSELTNFLPALLAKIPKENITVVIDGIFDESPKVCADFGVKTVIHEKNRGKGAALMSGFESMGEDVEWVITMDADGQHSPDDLDDFLQKIEMANPKTAIILGARKRSLKLMPPARIFSNWSTSAFVSFITKQKVADSQCGYRAYRLKPILSINCRFLRFEMESECILRLKSRGFFVENVPVQTLYCAETSHISHIRDTFAWLKAMILTIIDTKKQKRVSTDAI
ncbi:MAG: glycosyltransferase family 2 protein [Chitinivibrionia bacterium]|nr:glycosyltransferase family 2 protein [Chitinivibrionia bacterium]